MTNTILTQRGKVQWVQVVASKSGGAAHMVRCFEDGVTTCDCAGFNWRGTCSHIAAGKLQEAREALAQATSADAARKAAIISKGNQALADLFPELVAA